MKKLVLTLFAAAALVSANAQSKSRNDNHRDFHWESRSHQVWVPEKRTGSFQSSHGRIIPGHYETRVEKVKVYQDDRYNDDFKTAGRGWSQKEQYQRDVRR